MPGFHNLERKTAPVEEPIYHLSIEPVRCPDKTKEKFILFYTPIAANATRVRNGPFKQDLRHKPTLVDQRSPCNPDKKTTSYYDSQSTLL